MKRGEMEGNVVGHPQMSRCASSHNMEQFVLIAPTLPAQTRKTPFVPNRRGETNTDHCKWEKKMPILDPRTLLSEEHC